MFPEARACPPLSPQMKLAFLAVVLLGSSTGCFYHLGCLFLRDVHVVTMMCP